MNKTTTFEKVSMFKWKFVYTNEDHPDIPLIYALSLFKYKR